MVPYDALSDIRLTSLFLTKVFFQLVCWQVNAFVGQATLHILSQFPTI